MHIREIQTLINNHSKFTDTFIKEIGLKYAKENSEIFLLLHSQFENSIFAVTLEGVKSINFKIDNIMGFGVYELEVKEVEDFYLFEFSPVGQEMGKLLIEAKSIKVSSTHF